MTINEWFGVNASQTADTFTISKSDLPGLTPSANNSAESLLSAIILKAREQCEGLVCDELGRSIASESGFIEYDNSELFDLVIKYWRLIVLTRNGSRYFNHQITIFNHELTD